MEDVMDAVQLLHFPPFRLDLVNEQLWREETLLPVRPKPFAVLKFLATHPGRVVTTEEVRKAVWPQTYVSVGVVRAYIRDLRAVLEDDPARPRFIETVERRGYRFIAPLTPTLGATSREVFAASRRAAARSPQPIADNRQLTTSLAGREAELSQLHGWLEQALGGARQIVFVTGEPGVSKTALVQAFLAQ